MTISELLYRDSSELYLVDRYSYEEPLLSGSSECLVNSDVYIKEIIRHKNIIYGALFDPEVSGEFGMKMIKNFLRISGILE